MAAKTFSYTNGYDDEVLKADLGLATETKPGFVKMAANVAEAASTAPTAAEFKALLDALIAADIMAEASED